MEGISFGIRKILKRKKEKEREKKIQLSKKMEARPDRDRLSIKSDYLTTVFFLPYQSESRECWHHSWVCLCLGNEISKQFLTKLALLLNPI